MFVDYFLYLCSRFENYHKPITKTNNYNKTMINQQLLNPQSIVVIGGSNDEHKPGGAILRNLKQGGFKGDIHVLNPKEDVVQGIKAYHDMKDLPNTDLAILVVAAKYCPDYVDFLTEHKGVRAFIIISAGFGEETHEGALLEQHILDTCEKYGAALIGPNCIGLLTTNHHSVFTRPIPALNPKGADFISGSGATAVFIIDSAVSKGLQFNSVWSIGNGKQIGIEDVLEYMDEHFDPEHDSKVKLLYIENISEPDRLLKHARSLIKKGCRIAAIKSGSSESGSRAASSHTGAIASSDTSVHALFNKAGIVRCYSRDELTTVGCVLSLPEMTGRNVAIVTHAGGPGVMLTDALSKGGLNVPKLDSAIGEELKALLYPGSSVANPIDFLATGTPEHLGTCIDFCEKRFDNVDAIVVIFGTPGLVPCDEAYAVLHEKMLTCKKPIFPVLPCVNAANREVQEFLAKGHVNFADEVELAEALTRVISTPKPATTDNLCPEVDLKEVRRIIDSIQEDGYIAPDQVRALLQAAAIPVVPEKVSSNRDELVAAAREMGYPIVVKVVGPVHKSDVGGVKLNVMDDHQLEAEFDRMMQIPDATAVMIQKMISGTELFIGAKYEPTFGHNVLCGLGGIFVEVLKDVQFSLAPLSQPEAQHMVRALKSYKIIQGMRGQKGLNEELYVRIIMRLSTMLRYATEIKEMDINPLLADSEHVTAVDARIRVEKKK